MIRKLPTSLFLRNPNSRNFPNLNLLPPNLFSKSNSFHFSVILSLFLLLNLFGLTIVTLAIMQSEVNHYTPNA